MDTKPVHFKKLHEGRSLEAMLGSWGIKTSAIVTNEDLIQMARDVFQLKGETILDLHAEAQTLGRGARRKLAMAYVASLAPTDLSKAIAFTYRNYRGEVGSRLVTPQRIFFADSRHEYHPGQWVMRGWDHDKKEFRDFAWKDIGPISQPFARGPFL